MMFLCDMIMIRYQNQCSAPIIVESLLIVGNWIVKGPTVPFQSRLFLHLKFMVNNKKTKGNSNFELGTAICYVNVENYFLTIISCSELKVRIPIIHLQS